MKYLLQNINDDQPKVNINLYNKLTANILEVKWLHSFSYRHIQHTI